MALLYLRVISACADGKIRIYNFLNGNCLKVIKANGRGDPVLSFFFQGNRWVVGVAVRAVSVSLGMTAFSAALDRLARGESGLSFSLMLAVRKECSCGGTSWLLHDM